MLWKAILLALVTIATVPILKSALKLSVKENHHNQRPGYCRQVNMTSIGSEDIQITSSGLAFITSGVTYAGCSGDFSSYVKLKGPGGIHLLDMSEPFSSLAKELRPLPFLHGEDFNPDTFRPSGMSLLEDEITGQHLLYVVNYVENEAYRIEKFRYLPEKSELLHLASFFSDLFRLANNLVVVREDEFYVSNYLYSKNQAMAIIEQLYRLPLCKILFHNGTRATPVVENLHTPNGLTLSKDKRFLYAGFTEGHEVRVYEIKSDLDLHLVQQVAVNTGIDNFHLSEDGTVLYAGCQPNHGRLMSHLMDPRNKAPSQVLSMALRNGLIVEEEITQVFYDTGALISGSSVAGVFKDKMVIGSIVDTTLLCQFPDHGLQ